MKPMIKNCLTAKFVTSSLTDRLSLPNTCVQNIRLISHLSASFAQKHIESAVYWLNILGSQIICKLNLTNK